MDLRFKTNLLEHAKVVSTWAQVRGARAEIDAITFTLVVRLRTKQIRFHPQFVGKKDDGTLAYFRAPRPSTIGFVGWLPYPTQTWDLSASKLTFKSRARDLGIATPAQWATPELSTAPFLVKRTSGAFGYGMHGPYRAGDAPPTPMTDGDFCEEFKWGRVARAWYWSDRLAALELFEMPRVHGDGQSTYEALLRGTSSEAQPQELAALAALQGIKLGDVVPTGQSVVCDYRYLSPFNPTVYSNHNVLGKMAGTALLARLEEAAQRLVPHLAPPPGATEIGFVLDAIVDEHDQPWFLELNSNPQGHPNAYIRMLDSLFGFTQKPGAVQPVPMAFAHRAP